ncbi:hypothetical protein OF829_10670 [Sphingomonas sp. LB-2]|uniref:hypothetical protein n=1 Tax=Sphingomonas caeni TaxID=2984949 RepID=UPI00222F16C6|nr:hypothetical protein [Sphingomonas caeni]MCW3847703.1 hypothetical protein [Sphingomonas caeni]
MGGHVFDSTETLIATAVAAVALLIALFAGGKPADLGRMGWQIWVVGGLALLGLIFVLSQSLDTMNARACAARYTRC